MTSTGGLQLGKPVPLFDVGTYFFGGQGRNYDVAPDGRRFITVKDATDQQQRLTPVTIVLNCVEEQRARMR